MLNIFRRKNNNEEVRYENENSENEVEFEYHNYYPPIQQKDVVEQFVNPDRLLVLKYGEQYPLYTSKDFATAFITKAQHFSIILSARIDRNIKLSTKYTAEEIDYNPDLLTEHMFVEDIALIRGSKSIEGNLAKLALQYHQVYVHKNENEDSKRRWRWL